MAKYISCADTAKLIRKALKEHFSGIKFSVKSSSYAGGASIRVEWLDGPSEKLVEKIVKKFQGASFDSSIDLKSYHDSEYNGEQVHFGADYVFCTRRMSREFLEAVVSQFCKSWGIPMLEIIGNDKYCFVNTNNLDYSKDHWLSDLLRNTDAKDMHRVYEAEQERDAREWTEWEAGAEQREREAEEARKRDEEEENARREQEAREQERRDREQAEKSQKQQQQRERDAYKQAMAMILSSRAASLLYLGVSASATKAEITNAFREKVKSLADGKGGYAGDMDFLVKVKEKALG